MPLQAAAKPQFAALPLAATGDARLTASHHRLLGTISYHDRMGRNGQGCYALQSTLAREAAVDYTNVARLTRDLRDWGYIEITEDADDKRRKTYRVKFDASRAENVGGHTNKPERTLVDAPTRMLVKTAENVGGRDPQPTGQTGQSAPLRDHKRTVEKKSCEAPIQSAEAVRATQASRGGPPPLDGDFAPAFDALDECDSRLKSITPKIHRRDPASPDEGCSANNDPGGGSARPAGAGSVSSVISGVARQMTSASSRQRVDFSDTPKGRANRQAHAEQQIAIKQGTWKHLEAARTGDAGAFALCKETARLLYNSKGKQIRWPVPGGPPVKGELAWRRRKQAASRHRRPRIVGRDGTNDY